MESEAQTNEIKLISTEMVKPSAPTPPERQIFTLSRIDQNSATVSLPSLLVYPNSTTTTEPNDIVTNLKDALAKTLTTFYPLAGRCVDKNTVFCNDQGTPFRETHVNCRLTDVLNSPLKFEFFAKFVPPFDPNQPISEFAPLSFQVNVFECGGIVIGFWGFHKLLDATSSSCFLNHWAAIASNRLDSLTYPDFASTVAAFPPSPAKVVDQAPPSEAAKEGDGEKSNNESRSSWESLKSTKVAANNFIFSGAAIKELKAKAASDLVPNPTSFEAVAGFVWKHLATNQSDPTKLAFGANIRSRTSPPLPKQSMGNVFVDLHAVSEKSDDISDYVQQIHATILMIDQKLKTMQGEIGAKQCRAERESGTELKAAVQYILTSWYRLGFGEVDFGFGKPSKLIPFCILHPYMRNMMVFNDYHDGDGDGDGIEVWLFLGEKELRILESDHDFRAYATLQSSE